MKASRNLFTVIQQSLLILSTAFFATAAIAQETLLEEIIVVGTKVQDGINVQDAPYAITTLTGGYLEEAGIKDVFDMQQNVPGLIVGRSQSATTSNFSIRGIGTSSNNFGLESSVGLYVDGVYRSRQSSMIGDLVDVSSVEVFKGPQGTLFGKNTPQGAIQILTVKPDPDDPNAFVELTAGDYGLAKLSAASSFALGENTAMRATLSSTQRDGYVSDISFGEDVFNDRDRFGVRLQLYSTPSDRLDVRIIADYSEIDEVCCVALSRVDALYAHDSLTNPLGPTPGPDAILAQLGGTVFTDFPYPAPFLAPFGPAVVTGVGFDQYLTAVDVMPRSTSEDSGLSVELNYDLDSGMTLTSVTGYRSFDTFDFIDADFTNVALLERTNSAQQSSISQELRLATSFGNVLRDPRPEAEAHRRGRLGILDVRRVRGHERQRPGRDHLHRAVPQGLSARDSPRDGGDREEGPGRRAFVLQGVVGGRRRPLHRLHPRGQGGERLRLSLPEGAAVPGSRPHDPRSRYLHPRGLPQALAPRVAHLLERAVPPPGAPDRQPEVPRRIRKQLPPVLQQGAARRIHGRQGEERRRELLVSTGEDVEKSANYSKTRQRE